MQYKLLIARAACIKCDSCLRPQMTDQCTGSAESDSAAPCKKDQLLPAGLQKLVHAFHTLLSSPQDSSLSCRLGEGPPFLQLQSTPEPATHAFLRRVYGWDLKCCLKSLMMGIEERPQKLSVSHFPAQDVEELKARLFTCVLSARPLSASQGSSIPFWINTRSAQYYYMKYFHRMCPG